jgi:acyl-CoA thioester hydrolase
MAVVYRHQVRYHEVDQQGFLFNAHVLAIADVGLTELFRTLGWRYDELVAAGTDPSLAKTEITFHQPARFDDVLDVDVTPAHVGRSSFTLRFALHRGVDPIATVATVYVNVDPTTATSRPLPGEVAARLRAALPTS